MSSPADLQGITESFCWFVPIIESDCQQAENTCRNVKFALSQNVKLIITDCPEVAVHHLTTLQGPPEVFSAGDLVYLGRWCEGQNQVDNAVTLYQLVETAHRDASELEMALYRLAAIRWHRQRDGAGSLSRLEQLLSRFPSGPLMFEAEDLRDEIRRQVSGPSSQVA